MWRAIRILSWLLGCFLFIFFIWDFGNFIKDTQETHKLQPVIDTEAIVVLAGDPSRIPSAVRLLLSRKSPLLVISGTGKHTTLTDLLNQQTFQDTPLSEVWDKIRFESTSTSTVENAKEARKIVETNHIKRIVLVTSRYHLPRARAIFQELIPNVEYNYYAVTGDSVEMPAYYWRLGVEYTKLLVFKYYRWLVQTNIFPRVTLYSITNII